MIEIYIDGASKGNPGPSGIGIFIKKQKENYEYSLPIENCNNHQAEFWAFIHALEICISNDWIDILSIRTDSKIVEKCMESKYCTNEQFKPLFDKGVALMEKFPYVFVKWIPESQNKRADQLARKAIHF